MFFLKVRPKKKKLDKGEEARLNEMMQRALGVYVKREELEKCLANIEKDENRRKLWASLSTRKKIKVLRSALEKKGEKHGK